ncbi:hypothetical protein [Streptodolium elevatio]|uniref:Uncharacterized protein n=1 Tax=Streptodolium elevatio TaxID=3157996 RepID=A0ABV3DTG4_9ACTN
MIIPMQRDVRYAESADGPGPRAVPPAATGRDSLTGTPETVLDPILGLIFGLIFGLIRDPIPDTIPDTAPEHSAVEEGPDEADPVPGEAA